MANVVFTIAGKPFSVDCGDGQEAKVRATASLIDLKARSLVAQFGDIDMETLLLMVAILAFTDLEKERARSMSQIPEEDLAEAISAIAAKLRRITESLKNA